MFSNSPLSASPLQEPYLAGSELHDYIQAKDDSFSWKLLSTREEADYSIHALSVNSIRWQNKDVISHPQWQHWVGVIVPKALKHSTALVSLTNGERGDELKEELERLTSYAVRTQAVLILVAQVPNQPMKFQGEDRTRKEDELIAYTWRQFFATQDPQWLLPFPMTKAVIRCIDAVQAWSQEQKSVSVPIKDIVITGESKRGWTSYLVAAMDKRVRAVIPVAIDTLNLPENLRYHHDFYGGWNEALALDYSEFSLLDKALNPEARILFQKIDPLAYRKLFPQDVYVVNSVGDEIFPPGASQHYFRWLPEKTQLRYRPNAPHSAEEVHSVFSYFYALLHQLPLPQLEWSFTAGQALSAKSDLKPKLVKLWQAEHERKDFRDMVIGKRWESGIIVPEAIEGSYRVSVPPSPGHSTWKAFFLEFHYPLVDELDFISTTEVFIIAPSKAVP